MVENKDTYLPSPEELEARLAEAGSEETQTGILTVTALRLVKTLKHQSEKLRENESRHMSAEETGLAAYIQMKSQELGGDLDEIATDFEHRFGTGRRYDVTIEATVGPNVSGAETWEETFETSVYLLTGEKYGSRDVRGFPKIEFTVFDHNDKGWTGSRIRDQASHQITRKGNLFPFMPSRTIVRDSDEVIFYEGLDLKDPRKEEAILTRAKELFEEKGFVVVSREEYEGQVSR